MAIDPTTGRGAFASQMRTRGHIVATIALGLPLVGAQLAEMAINTTDLVLLGRLSAADLAAGVLGTQAFFFFYIFGSGFTAGVMPLAASAYGRGDMRAVRRSVRMGLWVVILYSAAVMVPLYFIEPLLVAFGQEPEIAARAGAYMHVAQWAMFPALFVMGLRSFFTALGRAQIILWTALAGTALNAAIGYVFIFGNFGAPAMGIRGAGVSTLGTNALMVAVLVLYASRRSPFREYALFQRLWRPDSEVFVEVVRLGLPVSIAIIAEVGMFIVSSLMMGWLGTIPLAAHGIALQLSSIAFMIPLGLSHAATVRVSQAHGQGDLDGLGRAARAVLVLGVSVAVAGALLFWLVPDTLIGLFLDQANPQSDIVARIAVPLVAVAAAFQLADCLQVLGAGLLRGLKDTRVPMLLALFSYWVVGLPAAYGMGFGLGLGGIGVWSGLAAGLVCAAVLSNWRFYNRQTYGLV